MANDYVVIKLVRERTAPTEDAFSAKTLAIGTIIPVRASIENEDGSEVWLQRDDHPTVYVCKKKGKSVFCRRLIPEENEKWIEQVDAYLRTLKPPFRGTRP